MTRMNSKLSTIMHHTLISVAVAAAFAIALPASAATPAGKPTEEVTVATTATMPAATVHAKSDMAKSASSTSHSAKVEARITEMHAKLKITQAEEGQWGSVAEVMRDNAKTLDTLVQARMDHANAASAIDDLKSYSAIADANAEGTKKFVTVFETLYGSMSVAQKADADALFQGHHAGVGRTASKSHS
jgi:protein CpxP